MMFAARLDAGCRVGQKSQIVQRARVKRDSNAVTENSRAAVGSGSGWVVTADLGAVKCGAVHTERNNARTHTRRRLYAATYPTDFSAVQSLRLHSESNVQRRAENRAGSDDHPHATAHMSITKLQIISLLLTCERRERARAHTSVHLYHTSPRHVHTSCRQHKLRHCCSIALRSQNLHVLGTSIAQGNLASSDLLNIFSMGTSFSLHHATVMRGSM